MERLVGVEVEVVLRLMEVSRDLRVPNFIFIR